jgi:hypothetical protein
MALPTWGRRSGRCWRCSSRQPTRSLPSLPARPPAAAWVYRKRLWGRSLQPEEVEAMCTLKMETQGLDFGAPLRPSAPADHPRSTPSPGQLPRASSPPPTTHHHPPPTHPTNRPRAQATAGRT